MIDQILLYDLILLHDVMLEQLFHELEQNHMGDYFNGEIIMILGIINLQKHKNIHEQLLELW